MYTVKKEAVRQTTTKMQPRILTLKEVPMIDDNCIFCKLANGVFPTNTVYEDDDFRVILDIAPGVKGHALVMPKNHIPDVLSIDTDTAAKALTVVSKTANAIKKALCCDGVNVLQNNGEAAGQSVFHLHFHVIPRYHGDDFRIPWETLSYAEGEAEEMAAKIKNAF